MNTPTFKEQFDKITTAYFQNKLNPMEACACFIGNLLNGEEEWIDCRLGSSILSDNFSVDYTEVEGISCINKESNGLYDPLDIVRMECNFLKIWRVDRSEESLFMAMDSTLDMLRKIHESKGEKIDSFEFKKRELVKA